MNYKEQVMRQFWVAISSRGPMYKPEVIKIGISSTFMPRVRCKECNTGPDYYYGVMKPYMFKNVQQYKRYTELSRFWISRMCSDWYKDFDPRSFHKMGDFSYIFENKSIRPTLSRARGADVSDRDNVVEYVSCECGSTVWAFNQKSVAKRPEITNRKGKHKYPQKFIR
jgi:hypothetical protein